MNGGKGRRNPLRIASITRAPVTSGSLPNSCMPDSACPAAFSRSHLRVLARRWRKSTWPSWMLHRVIKPPPLNAMSSVRQRGELRIRLNAVERTRNRAQL
jgi:hypothetical protein